MHNWKWLAISGLFSLPARFISSTTAPSHASLALVSLPWHRANKQPLKIKGSLNNLLAKVVVLGRPTLRHADDNDDGDDDDDRPLGFSSSWCGVLDKYVCVLYLFICRYLCIYVCPHLLKWGLHWLLLVVLYAKRQNHGWGDIDKMYFSSIFLPQFETFCENVCSAYINKFAINIYYVSAMENMRQKCFKLL